MLARSNPALESKPEKYSLTTKKASKFLLAFLQKHQKGCPIQPLATLLQMPSPLLSSPHWALPLPAFHPSLLLCSASHTTQAPCSSCSSTSPPWPPREKHTRTPFPVNCTLSHHRFGRNIWEEVLVNKITLLPWSSLLKNVVKYILYKIYHFTICKYIV